MSRRWDGILCAKCGNDPLQYPAEEVFSTSIFFGRRVRVGPLGKPLCVSRSGGGCGWFDVPVVQRDDIPESLAQSGAETRAKRAFEHPHS